MKSVVAILLVAGASASSIIARDVPTVLADIADIKSKVATLTPIIGNFKSLDTDAAPLLAAEGAVETAIKKGTSDADATDPVDVAGANSVLSAVKDLIPTVVTALNAAVSNNAAFQSAGAGQILTARLNSLKTLTDAFAASLIKKAPQEAQSAAQAAISCIDSGFTSALGTPPQQASDCSGNIVLPVGGGGTSPSTSPSTRPSTMPPTSSPSPTSGASTGITTPIGSSTTYSVTSPSTTSSTVPTSSNGAVYTGNAASLVSNGFVGAVCVAGFAFLL